MQGLPALFARIIGGIEKFNAERADRRYLRDVLAGSRPVEMGSVAGQHDHASRRKSLNLVAVELIAEADVEHARHDRVDPVLRMPVWHQFCAAGRFHPDDVRAGVGGMADDDGKTHGRRKGRKGLPVYVLRQDRSENRLGLADGSYQSPFSSSAALQAAIDSHRLFQHAGVDRHLAQALTGCGKDRISDGGNDRRCPALTQATRRLRAFNDVDLNSRRLIHA
jgi:hypothetical protein